MLLTECGSSKCYFDEAQYLHSFRVCLYFALSNHFDLRSKGESNFEHIAILTTGA